MYKVGMEELVTSMKVRTITGDIGTVEKIYYPEERVDISIQREVKNICVDQIHEVVER